MTGTEQPHHSRVHLWLVVVRALAGATILLLVGAYSVGVVTGKIPEGQKIDLAHLALIVLGLLVTVLLVRPDALTRLKILKLGGVEVEMLEEVKEKQVRQESQLEVLSLIMPLLLPESERRHLLNLSQKRTSDYEGREALRAELRHLRAIGLIRNIFGHPIGEIRDGMKFDLADFVVLTELGERWAKSITQLDQDLQGVNPAN